MLFQFCYIANYVEIVRAMALRYTNNGPNLPDNVLYDTYFELSTPFAPLDRHSSNLAQLIWTH
jgi:hypothetical protein